MFGGKVRVTEPKRPTLAQLKRFVAIRAKSGYVSNLQFSIDAEEAGFKVELLGTPIKLREGHYRWDTPHGTLEEVDGVLELIV